MRFEPKRLAGYLDSDIIQEIRRVVAEAFGGVAPPPKDFARVARVNVATIKARFGSYGQAMTAAGIGYTPPSAKFTAAGVRANLVQVLSCADGYRFTYDFYRRNGGSFHLQTVKKILGLSWEETLTAIGAKPRPHLVTTTAYGRRRKELAKLTEADLFSEISRIWQMRGRRPTYGEFRKESRFNTTVYESRYGSWTKAVDAYCKAHGVRVQGKGGTNVTREMLLTELRSVQRKRAGDLLTYDWYKVNGGTYSIGTFQAHFGSWTKAVQAIKSKSGKQTKYSIDRLFDEMQQLWEEIGHQPSWHDMRRRGSISPKVYLGMFGSWTKAVNAFCEDRNSVQEPTPNFNKATPDPAPLPVQMAMPTSVVLNVESSLQVVIRQTPRVPSKRLRFRVLQRDNFTCCACGRSPAKEGITLHVDHVDAYSNGGETVFENLQSLCEDCNLGKSDL